MKKPDGILRHQHGKIMPVLAFHLNPSHDYLSVLWQYHNKPKDGSAPTYGGSLIEAVLITGNTDIANPQTEFFIKYDAVKMKGDVWLRIIELGDGSLWTMMTDDAPYSCYEEVYRPSWDWNAKTKIKTCRKMLGPHATRFYFLHKPSNSDLVLHKKRFLTPKKRGKIRR